MYVLATSWEDLRAIFIMQGFAGFSLFGVFEGISREKVQEQFDVNVFGVMEVTRALLPHFRRKNRITGMTIGHTRSLHRSIDPSRQAAFLMAW